MARPTLLCASLLWALGCGSTTKAIGNDAAPEEVEGGGTTGGPIDGRLNVFVFDEDTEEPIEGATVLVGDGLDPELVAETDEEGLVTFRQAGLEGPLDVTYGKNGYATVTVVGLDAANATFGLNPHGARPDPETGVVRGTVEGFLDLPESTEFDFYAALVGFAQPQEEERRDVEQPEGDANRIVRGTGPTTYEVTVPAGTVTLVAYLVHFMPHGPAAEDDEIEYLSFGLLTDVEVGAGETVEGVEIPLEAGATETLTIDWPSAVEGTDTVDGVAAIDLGADGTVVVFAPKDPVPETFQMPPLEGAFANGEYVVWARAVDSDAQDARRQDPDSELLVPESSRVVGGFHDASDVPSFPSLLDLPTGLSVDGRTWSFDPVSGSTVHTLSLREEGSDENSWTVVFLDPAVTEVALPEAPDGIEDMPAGDIDARAQAIALRGFDPSSFVSEDLADRVLASAVGGEVLSP